LAGAGSNTLSDPKKLSKWEIKELIARTEYIVGQLEGTDAANVKHVYQMAIRPLNAQLSKNAEK
jgi:hypothetical protein